MRSIKIEKKFHISRRTHFLKWNDYWKMGGSKKVRTKQQSVMVSLTLKLRPRLLDPPRTVPMIFPPRMVFSCLGQEGGTGRSPWVNSMSMTLALQRNTKERVYLCAINQCNRKTRYRFAQQQCATAGKATACKATDTKLISEMIDGRYEDPVFDATTRLHKTSCPSVCPSQVFFQFGMSLITHISVFRRCKTLAILVVFHGDSSLAYLFRSELG